jgi:hypothetical protein
MRVLIVGAKERDTDEDRRLVAELMDRISAEAPYTLFVSMMTHTGVGRFVKDKALQKSGEGRYAHRMIDCSQRIFAKGLAKSELVELYLARNATPFESSDMLIYLASEDRRGTCEELLERFQKANRPVLVMRPGDPIPEHIIDRVEV